MTQKEFKEYCDARAGIRRFSIMVFMLLLMLLATVSIQSSDQAKIIANMDQVTMLVYTILILSGVVTVLAGMILTLTIGPLRAHTKATEEIAAIYRSGGCPMAGGGRRFPMAAPFAQGGQPANKGFITPLVLVCTFFGIMALAVMDATTDGGLKSIIFPRNNEVEEVEDEYIEQVG